MIVKYFTAVFFALLFCSGVSAQTDMSTNQHKKLHRACMNNDGVACEKLALHYDQLAKAGGGFGWGVDSAFEKKIEYARRGCALKQKYSCDAMGWAYEHGQESLPKSDDHAVVYYVNGCENGSALSCNNLALAAQQGRGMKKSEANAEMLFKKACNLGYSDACHDPESVAKRAQKKKQQAAQDSYEKMEFGPLQDACTSGGDRLACVEIYKRERGNNPEAFIVAEHICVTWNYGEWCHQAGLDLYSGLGATQTNPERAYDNFYDGCYKRSPASCYMAANMKYNGAGIAADLGQAHLLYTSACTSGYKNACALKRKTGQLQESRAQQATWERFRKQQERNPNLVTCTPVRVVGHGGRTYTSADCKTNRERGIY